MVLLATDDVERALERLAIARHDEAAWTTLHGHLWPYVVAIAYRELNGRRDAAEDTAQETFLRLVRYAPFPQLRSAADLRAYAGTVARRAARDRSMQDRRRNEAGLEDAEGGLDVLAESAGPVEPLLPEDAAVRWSGALDDQERKLLDLLVKGSTLPAVAAALGIRYGAAAVRVHRLKGKLRNLMSP